MKLPGVGCRVSGVGLEAGVFSGQYSVFRQGRQPGRGMDGEIVRIVQWGGVWHSVVKIEREPCKVI
jgi:hypothetical protein